MIYFDNIFTYSQVEEITNLFDFKLESPNKSKKNYTLGLEPQCHFIEFEFRTEGIEGYKQSMLVKIVTIVLEPVYVLIKSNSKSDLLEGKVELLKFLQNKLMKNLGKELEGELKTVLDLYSKRKTIQDLYGSTYRKCIFI